MHLPKIVLLAAALPLSFLWSCKGAQARSAPETVQSAPPAGWEEDSEEPTEEAPDNGASWVEQPGSGTDPFPLKSIHVSARITGTVAHVEVDQVFGNRNAKPVTAVYVFPLPHQAAIHDLSIRMGNKVVRAKIQRKADARRTYENAARQGKTAALLEQERPNLFQQSVANIMPGQELTVRTVMDMPVAPNGDMTEFVFPTAVGPRFCPPGSVPDLGKIGAPRLPAGMAPPQRLSMDVMLDAGVPVSEIVSPSHELSVSGTGDWRGPVAIRLRDGSTIPNKDFLLRWKARGDRPLASVVTDGNGDKGHFLLQIQPPRLGSRSQTSGKELVFLVDRSGSMSGEPLDHVKKAMRKALRQMDPRDKFQIVSFSNDASAFESGAVQATTENVARGVAYVDALQAGGGTWMLNGFREAFQYKPAPGELRIVCLMSDGFIGNEDEILQAVEREMGERTRVFALGVGSSVNRWFVEELAARGKGKAQVATLDEDPADKVKKFLETVRRPVITGVTLEWNGVEIADQVPAKVPDLFDGEPLVVAGRFLSERAGTVVVRGECNGRSLRLEVPVDPTSGEDNGAVSTLWARARIAEMERTNQGNPDAGTVEEMTKLALKHRLASQYTSFVAVVEKAVNPDGKAQTVQVPQALPEGVTENALGGGADRTMKMSGVAYGVAAAGGTTETRSVAWPASSPSSTMSSSVMSSMVDKPDGFLGEDVDPSQPNMVDVILAGGGGTLKKGEAKEGDRCGRCPAEVDRMAAVGGTGLGTGGRSGFGTGAAVRAKVAVPKAADIELGGEAGSRSPESILRVIRAHLGGFRYSYEKFLRANPKLSGRITLKFTIAPSGDIIAISIVKSETGSPALDQEIQDKAKRMKFDQIEKGNVTITYALNLDKN